MSDDGVRVVCFGVLRERLGAETVIGETVATVADLWSVVTRGHPDLEAARDRVRAARNLAYCDWNTPVEPGDEVAFMPPVAGGATDDAAGARVHAEMVTQPIDIGRLLAEVRGHGDGAVASFTGVVRDNSQGRAVVGLDYEAYLPMANQELGRIAAETAARHHLSGIAVVHRIGSLAVGEVSIAVTTAAPHRRQALAACADTVEAIKRDLPVWKRERYPDGTAGVDARVTTERPRVSHLDESGAIRMVDVSDRPTTARSAAAEAMVRVSDPLVLAMFRGGAPKGDVSAAARLAGILAAKRTPELIPLCHPLPLTHVGVRIDVVDALPGVRIISSVRCTASTGVEMEALTAAAVAGLTVIDMLKSADPWISVESVRLLRKSGGRSGEVERP